MAGRLNALAWAFALFWATVAARQLHEGHDVEAGLCTPQQVRESAGGCPMKRGHAARLAFAPQNHYACIEWRSPTSRNRDDTATAGPTLATASPAAPAATPARLPPPTFSCPTLLPPLATAAHQPDWQPDGDACAVEDGRRQVRAERARHVPGHSHRLRQPAAIPAHHTTNVSCAGLT